MIFGTLGHHFEVILSPRIGLWRSWDILGSLGGAQGGSWGALGRQIGALRRLGAVLGELPKT